MKLVLNERSRLSPKFGPLRPASPTRIPRQAFRETALVRTCVCVRRTSRPRRLGERRPGADRRRSSAEVRSTEPTSRSALGHTKTTEPPVQRPRPGPNTAVGRAKALKPTIEIATVKQSAGLPAPSDPRASPTAARKIQLASVVEDPLGS